ncbi:hypothetical protein AVEN_239394-1 [Araneus ventricosus]|uniref:Uncharacterized protein n=1 Tax=Araneus ventricosus TaxID=182803 RepID=A0A4Y2RVF0_ARAVE|nr:hypothetical protein AVEN_239394-1 [Araneus ventricosus]
MFAISLTWQLAASSSLLQACFKLALLSCQPFRFAMQACCKLKLLSGPLFVRFMSVKLNYKKERKKAPLIAISHKNRTRFAERDAIPLVFPGLLKPTKNLNEYCGSTLHRRATLFQ